VPVRLSGSTVELVGCLPQYAAAERGGRHPQRVRGGAGSIGSNLGVGTGAGSDLLSGISADTGGVIPQAAGFLSGQ